MRLRNMAAKEKQYSAAITAEVARGKASGVHVERVEHTGKDGGPMETITRIELVDMDGNGSD